MTNLQVIMPPQFHNTSPPYRFIIPTKVADKYLLLNTIEGRTLRHCINMESQQEFVCQVLPNERSRDFLLSYFRLGSHPHIDPIVEVISGRMFTHVIFPRRHGDLECYVFARQNLQEVEARSLFKQVASAVAACHQACIVVKDLSLRKFVFKDLQRSQLKLETLDKAVVLEDDDDSLSDRHAVAAYVSPEILNLTSNYSGRAADCWSLGVMLYTMLVGRFPFDDTNIRGHINQIRRGSYTVPEHLSFGATCLIRSLLQMDPAERLTAVEVLDHPWLRYSKLSDDLSRSTDQTVPNLDVQTESDLSRSTDQTVPNLSVKTESDEITSYQES